MVVDPVDDVVDDEPGGAELLVVEPLPGAEVVVVGSVSGSPINMTLGSIR